MVTSQLRISRELARREGACALDAVTHFSEHRCTTMAAGIAFYSAFSLAPMLVMVIAVAGWFFGANAIRGEIFDDVHQLIGDDAAQAVQMIVANARTHSGTGGFAALVSFVALALGASATFAALNSALSIVWPVPAVSRTLTSVVALVKVRLISFGLVLGVAFLSIVSLVLDTVITFVGEWLWGGTPYAVAGDLLQLSFGLAVLALSFAALLKFLPDAHVPWRDAVTGGIVAALLFSGGKKVFALYLAHAGMANAFGAAGSLAALLMWLYFSAAVLLLGAEFAAARGRQRRLRQTEAAAAAGIARAGR
ncbi:YihY/virulence factor BrkB family protein [Trinickia caryophylli]|uniref:tRNA-processing RNAse BN n=1 Tax=Trinickia caryophylli TaxID=28094 RepID=A0A1X7G2B2_TRICW|nr:YihY/virulence factor BrkB family protein [Trinickia caryophylli]PMS13703.1 YihY/virulence factor BrkB family protein [Trinickia caryophylli]TRX14195.1 YihY/virulence factor BrkB family protein [Trinickia caryophylli]WQE14019.1 YihY/virulence factor BrkB family protein [Trinickia caryophylli]SMF62751.1 tRNA-processing RNAse BN [Trinickia caryophylli]GLU33495.1 ribonuclease [Trinickia caryophylli]